MWSCSTLYDRRVLYDQWGIISIPQDPDIIQISGSRIFSLTIIGTEIILRDCITYAYFHLELIIPSSWRTDKFPWHPKIIDHKNICNSSFLMYFLYFKQKEILQNAQVPKQLEKWNSKLVLSPFSFTLCITCPFINWKDKILLYVNDFNRAPKKLLSPGKEKEME